MTIPIGTDVDALSRIMPPERYARAERFLPWNARQLLFGMGVDPQWIDGGDGFWFRSETAGGPRYHKVETGADAVVAAFDHVRLAAALSRASGAPFDADRLDLDDLSLHREPERVTFSTGGHAWTCDLGNYACTPGDRPATLPSNVVRSPDGLWEAFVQDHDLWLRNVADGTERRLTDDGEADYGDGATLPSP